jgi:hypothetical protein
MIVKVDERASGHLVFVFRQWFGGPVKTAIGQTILGARHREPPM